jgi:hypothetical protein
MYRSKDFVHRYFDRTHLVTVQGYTSMIRVSTMKVFGFYENKIKHVLSSFQYSSYRALQTKAVEGFLSLDT